MNLQKKMYQGDLFHIKIKYHPTDIICTPEHPFYVREKTRIWNNARRTYEYSFSEPHWIGANKLTKDHYCGMTINSNSIIPSFSFEKKINQHMSEMITITLNQKDHWFMMGYFVGNGWIEETIRQDERCQYKIRFAIGLVHHDDTIKILERINNVMTITDKRCSSEKCHKYGCANFEWSQILKQFGKYAHDKRIPEMGSRCTYRIYPRIHRWIRNGRWLFRSNMGKHR